MHDDERCHGDNLDLSMLAEATLHCLTGHGAVGFADPDAALAALYGHLLAYPEDVAVAWELLNLPDWAIGAAARDLRQVAAHRRARRLRAHLIAAVGLVETSEVRVGARRARLDAVPRPVRRALVHVEAVLRPYWRLTFGAPAAWSKGR